MADSQDEDYGIDSDEEYGWINNDDAALLVNAVGSGG